MQSTELHVYGEDSNKIRRLIEKLCRLGFDVSHSPNRNPRPIIHGPNGEVFEGEDIQKTFFPEDKELVL